VSPCNSPWWRVRSSGIEHRVFACHVSMRDTSMEGCRRPSWVTRCVQSRSPLAMCRLATCRQRSIESDNMALAPQVSICHMVRSKWRKGLLSYVRSTPNGEKVFLSYVRSRWVFQASKRHLSLVRRTFVLITPAATNLSI
jgi:hypothetical protein